MALVHRLSERGNMRIAVDTHSHTLASGHAYNTMREMAQAASGKGLEALALTEHAPEMPGTCGLFYFENLKIVPREMYGVKLLLGTELNIMNEDGEVDLNDRVLKDMDIVIASIHRPCFGFGHTKDEITSACVKAMQNPYINILGHPDDGRFPVDFEVLAKTAKETGTLLEVNNSSLREDNTRENARENLKIMLGYCKKYGVMVSTGSDSHVDIDVGGFDLALEALRENEFPEELVATTSLEKIRPFLNRYKKL